MKWKHVILINVCLILAVLNLCSYITCLDDCSGPIAGVAVLAILLAISVTINIIQFIQMRRSKKGTYTWNTWTKIRFYIRHRAFLHVFECHYLRKPISLDETLTNKVEREYNFYKCWLFWSYRVNHSRICAFGSSIYIGRNLVEGCYENTHGRVILRDKAMQSWDEWMLTEVWDLCYSVNFIVFNQF